MMRIGRMTLLAAILVGCRDERQPTAHKSVEPPVDSPSTIPDAPLSGTLRGAPFVLRDARYFVDRRIGYAHTDILLSAGKSESPCGPVAPARSTSVWLRMDGPAKIETKDLKIAPGAETSWSVHYQVFDGEAWMGTSEGSAVLSMNEPGADGRVFGRLAVCFADDLKSCVSGSFDAQNCPSSLDQPVRGTPAPEAIPEKYRHHMVAGAALPAASTLPVASTPPAPSARHK